jgi:hypothetical protein
VPTVRLRRKTNTEKNKCKKGKNEQTNKWKKELQQLTHEQATRRQKSENGKRINFSQKMQL